MKVVNYSINTFYVLKWQFVCDLLNYFWKSGNLRTLVPFQVWFLSRETTGTGYTRTVPGTRRVLDKNIRLKRRTEFSFQKLDLSFKKGSGSNL